MAWSELAAASLRPDWRLQNGQFAMFVALILVWINDVAPGHRYTERTQRV